MTEDQKDLIGEAADTLFDYLWAQADRHYDTYIFKADYPGQTSFDKYVETWGKDTYELIGRLRDLANEEV